MGPTGAAIASPMRKPRINRGVSTCCRVPKESYNSQKGGVNQSAVAFKLALFG
jgi:hypothetical protein